MNQKIIELFRYCQMCNPEKRVTEDDKLYMLKEMMDISGLFVSILPSTAKHLLMVLREVKSLMSMNEQEVAEMLSNAVKDNPEIFEKL